LRSGKSNADVHANRNIVAVPITDTYDDANPLLRQVYTNPKTSP
jgi:hypothetical protein